MAAFDSDPQTLATRLFVAFNDPGVLGLGGTDEEEVLAVLKIARDNGLMKQVDAAYHRSYPDEPNLKDELDDELSGDEFKTAMLYYNQGMAPDGPATRTGAGANRSGGSKNPVHGTLAPQGVERKWREAVLAGLSELQRKIEAGSGCTFGDAGEPWGRWDTDNWRHNLSDGSNQNISYSPRTAPSAAVDALSLKLEAWTLDCATFAEAALLLIWRKFLGNGAAFDKRFSGLILRDQHSEKLPMQFTVTRPDEASELGGFNAAWDASLPGTKVSWTNLSRTVAGTAWQFEFAVKRRTDGTAGGQWYDAFPLGSDRDEAFIKRRLAEQAVEFPMRYTLHREGIEEVEAEEKRVKPLHTILARSIPIQLKDRLPQQAIRNLKDTVAGKEYPHYGAFRHALNLAGVPEGFWPVFKDVAKTSADEAKAEAYIKANIVRSDYARPILS